MSADRRHFPWSACAPSHVFVPVGAAVLMTEVLGRRRFQGCFEHVAGEQPPARLP